MVVAIAGLPEWLARLTIPFSLGAMTLLRLPVDCLDRRSSCRLNRKPISNDVTFGELMYQSVG